MSPKECSKKMSQKMLTKGFTSCYKVIVPVAALFWAFKYICYTLFKKKEKILQSCTVMR